MASKVAVARILERFRNVWNRADLGERGEDVAARELLRVGYRIVERRWRPKRGRRGELDIVAWDGDTLVIVEVKTRSRTTYGRPADAVDWAKRRKLVRLAGAYLRARRLGNVRVRFDVVGVHLPPGEKPRVELLRNAFGA